MKKYNESLIEEARHLNQDLSEKTNAAENLMNIISNKSQEINKLMHDIDKERDQNLNLHKQLNELRDRFESEKLEALQSLQVARQESQELLDKVKDYDQVIHKKAEVTKSLEQQLKDKKSLQDLVKATIEENRKLKMELDSRESNDSVLLKEIERLRNVNEYADLNINSLEDENMRYKTSLDLTLKESGELRARIRDYEKLTLRLQNLQEAHDKLCEEKTRQENELLQKIFELENKIQSMQLSKRESEETIDKLQQSTESKDNELSRIHEAYQNLHSDNCVLQKALMEKNRDMDSLLQTLNNLKLENETLLQKCSEADDLDQKLKGIKTAYVELSKVKNILEANRTEDLHHLEKKIEENRQLIEQIKSLEATQSAATNAIQFLQGEKMRTQSALNLIKKESVELIDKIKYYEDIETEYENLQRTYDEMVREKQNLQTELNRLNADLRKMAKENSELHSHSQNLLSHNEDLEYALMGARKEVIQQTLETRVYYHSFEAFYVQVFFCSLSKSPAPRLNHSRT